MDVGPAVTTTSTELFATLFVTNAAKGVPVDAGSVPSPILKLPFRVVYLIAANVAGYVEMAGIAATLILFVAPPTFRVVVVMPEPVGGSVMPTEPFVMNIEAAG